MKRRLIQQCNYHILYLHIFLNSKALNRSVLLFIIFGVKKGGLHSSSSAWALKAGEQESEPPFFAGPGSERAKGQGWREDYPEVTISDSSREDTSFCISM